jgi:hypothetical protein
MQALEHREIFQYVQIIRNGALNPSPSIMRLKRAATRSGSWPIQPPFNINTFFIVQTSLFTWIHLDHAGDAPAFAAGGKA